MNELACLILDYNRPQNMLEIIEAVNRQNINVDLYIVHQGNNREYDCFENIHLEHNRGPRTKYQILSLIDNPYTIIIDDDLKPVGENIFDVMLQYAKELKTLVGAYGLILGNNKNMPYTSGQRIFHTSTPVEVDIILANFHLVETAFAAKLWNNNKEVTQKSMSFSDLFNKDPLFGTNEDVILSYLYKKANMNVYVVGTGIKGYQELDNMGGLEFEEGHLRSRNELAKELFYG